MEQRKAALHIGVDLGGTKTEVIALLPDKSEVFRKRRPTPADQGYRAILENIVELTQEALHSAPGDHGDSPRFTFGIGIPGIIDEQTGRVINANTTVMIGHPLREDLERMLSCPVFVENDANCFTIAEAKAGAARGYDMVFGVIMGTGCGGGIYTGGTVRHGPHGIAGEWGHFVADPRGIECYCGNRGCIETLISGSGVERQHHKRTGSSIGMQQIVEGARRGDSDAKETFDQFLDDFGRSLGGLISILDPDAIVLGGGLSGIDELYTYGLEKIKQYAFFNNIKTPILKNQLGDSAGVLGAAWLGITASNNATSGAG